MGCSGSSVGQAQAGGARFARAASGGDVATPSSSLSFRTSRSAGEITCVRDIVDIDREVEGTFHRQHRINGRLGKGAFARVYAAERITEKEKRGQEVAVKITDLRLPGPEGAMDMRRHRTVEREATLLRQLANQRHCVKFVDACIEGFFSYLVMEKCDMSLWTALEVFPHLSEYHLAPIFKDMLHAIAGIHSVNVVHRDIKPDNYLFTASGCVKLCDFGLAYSLCPQRPELKDSYGTAPFMSPEMLAGEYYATKTDVWSFGVCCYVLMLGQFPYQGEDRSSKAMKAAIQAGYPKPTYEVRPSLLRSQPFLAVSDAGKEFLSSLLVRDPKARPTATAALASPWLSYHATPEEEMDAPNLALILSAAKRVSAFSPGNNDAESPMEAELAFLQTRGQGKDVSPMWQRRPSSKEPVKAMRPRAANRTNSNLSSCSTKTPQSIPDDTTSRSLGAGSTAPSLVGGHGSFASLADTQVHASETRGRPVVDAISLGLCNASV